ncbi:hypothetical protein E5D57_006709 [Metarhizium anisopliae]|nr:hypothetical protein E5D57_006709 [Metarhizium anisopliae]
MVNLLQKHGISIREGHFYLNCGHGTSSCENPFDDICVRHDLPRQQSFIDSQSYSTSTAEQQLDRGFDFGKAHQHRRVPGQFEAAIALAEKQDLADKLALAGSRRCAQGLHATAG